MSIEKIPLDLSEDTIVTYNDKSCKLKTLSQTDTFAAGLLNIGNFYFLKVNKSSKSLINLIGKSKFITLNTRSNLYAGLCIFENDLIFENLKNYMGFGFIFTKDFYVPKHDWLKLITGMLLKTKEGLLIKDWREICSLQLKK
ncbi:hypothetical protein M0R19_07475 [Candidatus Pacearchaeota archaeon]|nr:hypothetical protein [bacterium]MCK9597001.1 hypothetical protein [Candidatus Pacearchaeota archaeon]